MEFPEPCYGNYCFQEEELILTPQHTPSQSFDFIVWEKAYLDSIPSCSVASAHGGNDLMSPHECIAAAKPTKDASTRGGSLLSSYSSAFTKGDLYPNRNYNRISGPRDDGNCDHDRPNHPREDKGALLASSDSDALMACRTDADLPSFFFDLRRRTAAAAELLPPKEASSLEEAVRNYAERHQLLGYHKRLNYTQNRQLPPLNNQVIGSQGVDTVLNYQRAEEIQFVENLISIKSIIPSKSSPNGSSLADNTALNASLRRSHSQPGGSKGWIRSPNYYELTTSTTFTNQQKKSDPLDANKPRSSSHPQAQQHAKTMCFPAGLIGSPGRRKFGRTPCKDMTGDRSSPESYGPSASKSAASDPLEMKSSWWADYSPAAAGRFSGDPSSTCSNIRRSTAASHCNYQYSSHSDLSSLSSSDVIRLKWGLNHKIKALWRKLRSINRKHAAPSNAK